MGKKEHSIYDIVEYAKKYSVQDAVLAYSISKSSIYRYLAIQTSNKPNQESYKCEQPSVLLDFKSVLLIPEKIYQRCIIPGLYLLAAYDLNQNRYYYALSSESNKTVICFFYEYLCFKINTDTPNLIIRSTLNEEAHSNAEDKSIKFNKKWQIPAQIIDELTNNIPNSTLFDLQAIAFGSLIFNSLKTILPIYISAAVIKDFSRYVSRDAFWQEKYFSNQELFLKGCEYLVNKASDLFAKGKIEKSVSFAEKVIAAVEPDNESCKRTLSQAFILLGKACGFKCYHDQAINYFMQAINNSDFNGEACYQFSLYYLQTSNLEESKKWLLKARDLYAKDEAVTAKFYYYRIIGEYNFYHTTNYHNALVNFKKARDIAQKTDNQIFQFEANGFLANVHYVQRSFALAEEIHIANLIIAKALNDHAKISTTLYNLGLLYNATQRYELAENHFKKCLAIARKIQHSFKVENYLFNYATALLNRGQVAKAANCFKTLYAEINPRVSSQLYVSTCNYLGFIYKNKKNFNKSAYYFNEAASICNKKKISNHESYKSYINYQLAQISLQKKDVEKAVILLKKVISVTKKVAESPDIMAFSCLALAKIYQEQYKPAKAKELFIESRNVFKSLHLRTGLEKYLNRCSEISEILKSF